jgi:ATP-binding cassette subfamily B protein
MKTIHEDLIKEKNKIPDYEFLFRDTGNQNKVKSKIIKKLLNMNLKKLIASIILYIIKASPVWIVPVITANIINIASDPSSNWMYDLVINSIVLVLILLQNVPMHVWYARLTDRMCRSFSAGIKSAMIRKMQRLSITYHKEMESGKLQSKFLRDIENVDGLFSQMAKNIIPSVIMTLVSIGISVYKSGIVTVFFVVIIPVNLLLARIFSNSIRKNYASMHKANENMSSNLATMIEMIPVTKAHGLENKEVEKMESQIQNVLFKGLKFDKDIAYFGSWNWVFSNMLSSFCLIFCTVLAIKGLIGIGDIVLFQTMFVMINGNIQNIINNMPNIASGFESARSVSEVMMSDEIEKYGDAKIELMGDVEFKDVSYRYNHNSEYVIKHFSFHAKPGQCIAFVGPSGSGKSTLMNMIIGFLQVLEGELLIDGKPLSSLNLSDYRKQIAVVSQNPILFTGTIRENITYGLDHYTEEELQKVLEMANINEFLKFLPNGVDTFIGEHGGLLSGGQRQRVTIARALIRNPKILILDEATSALDNISEAQVQKAISASVKDRTTFIVAHRLSTIRNADWIVVMKEGACVEQGTFEDLMKSGGEFAKMVNLNDIKKNMATV